MGKSGKLRPAMPEHAIEKSFEERSERVFVILMSQRGFGSSTVGEIFNKNPKIFYLFEPLWMMSNEAEAGDGVNPLSTATERDILREIFRCKFRGDFTMMLTKYNEMLRTRRVCEVSEGTQCMISNTTLLDETCKRNSGRVAIKVVRTDLDKLKSLVVDDQLNVKILHLVRDPRGVASSLIQHVITRLPDDDLIALSDQLPRKGRLKALGLLNQTIKGKNSVQAYCLWMRQNLFNSARLPEWLEDHYKLLKFEEFASSPILVTKDIYNFVGLPVPLEIEQWLELYRNNTHTAKLNGLQSNLKERAQQWIFDLSESEVEQVEEECMDVINALGYQPYRKLKENVKSGAIN
ncbi:carbohydrate sulfotransferase 2-like [Diadema antillarum]|uniref:carbohydrate sulfotransferase 2-like n=1 Tax=Diadema antillarum TaxID=105358 RepID=UPI003A8507F9